MPEQIQGSTIEGESFISAGISGGPGTELVMYAINLLGTQYQFGGDKPGTGMDCSGFVGYVFRQAWNFDLPRTASEISRYGQPVELRELQAGDLVFYNTRGRRYSHVGIYLGNNRFIHSPRPGSQVRIEDMQLPYWVKRFNGARRIEARNP